MDIEEPAAEPAQQPAAAALSEQEAKRLRKLEQNRLAAQLSRQRKKQRTEELQKHIIEVSPRAAASAVSCGARAVPERLARLGMDGIFDSLAAIAACGRAAAAAEPGAAAGHDEAVRDAGG